MSFAPGDVLIAKDQTIYDIGLYRVILINGNNITLEYIKTGRKDKYELEYVENVLRKLTPLEEVLG